MIYITKTTGTKNTAVLANFVQNRFVQIKSDGFLKLDKNKIINKMDRSDKINVEAMPLKRAQKIDKSQHWVVEFSANYINEIHK